jgi:PKD repeat protein|tara:strand:- start:196 stop:480 length:285 start_codon:yes stop_codon:yes gene_type:complete
MAGQQTLTAPATVVFTDASIGEALSHSWKFGDGTNSENLNPIHTYQTPGTYTVELTVTTPDDLSDTATADIVVYQQSSGNGNGNGENGKDDVIE